MGVLSVDVGDVADGGIVGETMSMASRNELHAFVPSHPSLITQAEPRSALPTYYSSRHTQDSRLTDR